MCFEPTRDETARSEARRASYQPAADRPSAVVRREDPSSDPDPRGNQERDEHEVERSEQKLAAVLGH